MSKVELNEAQIGAMSVGCPECGAPKGKHCTNGTKLRKRPLPHTERVAQAKDVAALKARRRKPETLQESIAIVESGLATMGISTPMSDTRTMEVYDQPEHHQV